MVVAFFAVVVVAFFAVVVVVFFAVVVVAPDFLEDDDDKFVLFCNIYYLHNKNF